MHELHYIIHAEATRHAVITLTINKLPIGRINPASANQGCIRVCASGLEICLYPSLAIAPNNPTQRGKFTIQESRRICDGSLVVLVLKRACQPHMFLAQRSCNPYPTS